MGYKVKVEKKGGSRSDEAASKCKETFIFAYWGFKIGARQNMVSDYERGKRRLSPSMAKRFAKVLKINVDRIS